MSRRFSFDFSEVRLHLCERGVVDASAFAMGSDIFFCGKVLLHTQVQAANYWLMN